jgi:hypothetical protein
MAKKASFVNFLSARRADILAAGGNVATWVRAFDDTYMFSEQEARYHRILLTFPEFAEAKDLPLR